MELTVLGSGTLEPRLKRNPACNLVKAGKTLVLVDAGPGTIRRLLEAGVNPFQIDAILFSHLHNDHVNDLPALLWAYAFSVVPRKKKLLLVGPKGFRAYFRLLWKKILLLDRHLPSKKLPFICEIKELKGGSLNFKGIKIRVFPTRHPVKSVGYRLEKGGKSLAISGDTGKCEGVVSMGKNADLLALECSKPNSRKEPGHLTPKECGMIASEAECKKLLLTHIFLGAKESALRKGVKRLFRGKVLIGKDLMKVKV